LNQSTHTSPFVGIRHQDERGKEYWEPHELGKILGYSSLHSFQNTLLKARFSCEHSKQYVLDHFYLLVDVITAGNGALRKIERVRLSRYACYLTILDADPHKLVVALGQAYLAYQTRRQELVDQIPPSSHPEHVMQEALHLLLYTEYSKLQKAAQETRIVKPEDFALFFNHGYTGLIS
jgi:DNA-damage-inducible protein D